MKIWSMLWAALMLVPLVAGCVSAKETVSAVPAKETKAAEPEKPAETAVAVPAEKQEAAEPVKPAETAAALPLPEPKAAEQEKPVENAAAVPLPEPIVAEPAENAAKIPDAAEPNEPEKLPAPEKSEIPPPPPPRPMGKGWRGSGLWKIFSRLTPEEKKALLELQKKDGEQFRTKVKELAERFDREEKERIAENNRLAAECRENPADSAKGKKAREELRVRVAGDLQRHLDNNRRSLEESRRRLDRMEAELKKREANADKIVDAVMNDLISGKRPAPPPPHRRALGAEVRHP